MPRAGWLFLLLLVGCAQSRRAEYGAPAAQCGQRYNDPQAQECAAEAVARTAGLSPSQAYDELAGFIEHERAQRFRFEPSPEIVGLLVSLGSAVAFDVAELYAAGKTDLARRRGELLCSPWSEACPFRKQLDELDAVAKERHSSAARELSRAWPLASLLHRCLAEPDAEACKNPWAAVAEHRPGVALTVEVDKSCRAVFDEAGQKQLIAQVAPDGGPELGRFHLALTGCEATRPSDTASSERCYFDPQSQAREGRAYPSDSARERSEIASVTTMTRGFRIHATLHVGNGTALSRKAGLVDGGRRTIAVDQTAIGKQSIASPHCKLETVTIGEVSAATQAQRNAVFDLTDQIEGLTIRQDVATAELLWKEAFDGKRAGEAEHWAVTSYVLQRKAFPDTQAVRWLMDRHAWNAGVLASHGVTSTLAPRFVAAYTAKPGMVRNGHGRDGFPFCVLERDCP